MYSSHKWQVGNGRKREKRLTGRRRSWRGKNDGGSVYLGLKAT